MVTATPVLPLDSQILPGHNQETYQRLQLAVQATPPHQVWVATCDDLPLQRQLAATLEESLQGDAEGRTQLLLNAAQPNLGPQIRAWAEASHPRPPLLQILGIEQLTHRGSDAQYQFLRSLPPLLSLWPQLGCSLLIWMPRPWLKQIRREVPALCQQVFEFMGEPTPITAMTNAASDQAAFAPIRRWQFLGKPAPEAPIPPSPDPRGEALAVNLGAPAVPAIPGEGSLEDATQPPPESVLPSFSEDLWHQLQADLTEFEDPQTTLLPPPALPLDAPPPPDRPAVPTAPAGADEWTIAYGWRDRVQAGDHRPATLVAAVQAYERLQPHLPTAPQRTEVLNDLGSLYWLWAQQARDETHYWQRLSHSSALYEAALTPVSAGTEADLLNRLHSNLGSVYSLLAAHQDPPQFLGKAVRAFHRALQYAPVETMPAEYATLQTHLGTAYWSLAQHTQEAAHLHRAIAAYQEALHHTQPQQAPAAFGQLQNNLGIALWSLSRHERPVFLLTQAIAAYRTAVAYRTLDQDPAGCAATHNNLGTAYWDLGGHQAERSPHQQQAWQQAIAAYEAALLAAERAPGESLTFDQWATHHSVGVVYDQLAIALAPDAAAQRPLLTKATTHYVQALVGWHGLAATTAETALQALVRNLQLQARYLGIEGQQQSLSQVPAHWLPDIWRQL
ncbi:MAG TPA: hypothetical protein V6D02_11950 [Candidatus Obscuribacterales bacterium]